jgi:hypothetical protein
MKKLGLVLGISICFASLSFDNATADPLVPAGQCVIRDDPGVLWSNCGFRHVTRGEGQSGYYPYVAALVGNCANAQVRSNIFYNRFTTIINPLRTEAGFC